MPKDTKTLGNNKARACESLGFAHKKGCANILTQPHLFCFCFSRPSHFLLKYFFERVGQSCISFAKFELILV